MIDAAFSGESAATGSGRPAGGTIATYRMVVSAASGDALSSYRALCDGAVHAPAQSVHWVQNWVEQLQPDGLIASVWEHGRPVFALALEVTNAGPFRVARFMGGSHANGNFPVASPAWLASAEKAAVLALVEAIAAARPDIDALVLERATPHLAGQANPLLFLPHSRSPNIALSVDLQGGFDAILEQTSAKRKRKKHRSQMRKFEAAGGFRRIIAQTPEETRRLFDAFLEMKEKRFEAMGVANVFADAGIRKFFHALFCNALAADMPIFTLEGLEVGGELRAVTGTSRCGRRLICEFGGIHDDELATSSPGEFLFYENIKQACETGYDIYDFGVGDEPYKRLWCNSETHHIDVIMPLSGKGRIYTTGLKTAARLKAAVKNNPTAWRLAKSLRKRLVGKAG